MRKTRTLELAKTGTYGADGATITKKDIADIVETFEGTKPAVIGHLAANKDNVPKFGDVVDVWASGDGSKLIGDVTLHPEACTLYSDGKFNGWSVSIPKRAKDGKRYLHHLAFLGATPPKIPGLRELGSAVDYSDGEECDIFEFSGNIPDVKEESSMMTEQEKAEMEALKKKNAELEAEAKKAKEEKSKKEDFSDELSEREKAMQAQIDAMSNDRRQEKLNHFSDSIKGFVPAGVIEKATSVAEKLVDVENVNFSDNGKEMSVSALDVFGDILKSFPKVEEGSVYDFSDTGNSGGKKDGGQSQNNWAGVAQKL